MNPPPPPNTNETPNPFNFDKEQFEARMQAIENQPDYEQVMCKLLERDLQEDGGTLIRGGRKGLRAFFKLFEEEDN